MAVNQLIQVRRDTAANWTSVNPTLAEGEIGFETNTSKFKIGTGAAWNSTSYAPAGVTYGTGEVVASLTGSGGDIILPASGTVATTDVVDGYLRADGSINVGSAGLTFEGTTGTTVLSAASAASGTFSLPTSGTVLVSDTDVAAAYPALSGSSGDLNMGSHAISGITDLTASGTITFSGIKSSGNNIAKVNSTTGAITAGKAVLTTDVSGYLPAANGGLAADPTSGSITNGVGPAGLASARGTVRIFVGGYPATPAEGDLVFI